MGDKGWGDYNRLRDQESATAAAHTSTRRSLTRVWLRDVYVSLGLITLMALAGRFVTEAGPAYWMLLAGTLLASPLVTIWLTMNGKPITPVLASVLPGTFIGVFAAGLQFRSIDDNGFGFGFLLMAWLAGSVLGLILASMRAFERRRPR